jgi:Uma2 family endonuclease
MSPATLATPPSGAAVEFRAEVYPVTLQLLPAVPMTQDQFFDLCQQNPDLRLERTAEGEIIIMTPSGGEAGYQDAEVCGQLREWARAVNKGRVIGSSGGFTLPNGATRAMDAAWISPEQLATLTPEQWKKFLPLCPFFLIEVRSPSDRLKTLQEKMEEYIANGCQLGWLIDPEPRQVHVYRPGQSPQVLENPSSVTGDPEMPGFVLDLRLVWDV